MFSSFFSLLFRSSSTLGGGIFLHWTEYDLPPPPSPAMMALLAASPSQQHHIPGKNPRAAAFCALFSLSLLGVFLFSKRSLEPSVSVVTDHFSLSFTPQIPLLPPPPLLILPAQGPGDTPAAAGHTPEFPPEAGGGAPSGLSLEVPESSAPGPRGPDPEQSLGGRVRESEHLEKPVGEGTTCDLYDGSWVKDEEGSYPLYGPGTCPYVDDAFACQENGRPDGGYLRWRWKPRGCDLPRFNGTDFLERLRGKRLMLVGDSMNRNQFESMLCLLHEALPDKRKMYETRGYKITKGRGYFIFKFEDYDCTIEFCRSHFLVREGKHNTSQGKSRPSLLIDHIDKSATRWKHADILIFNTGHWWTHGKTSKGKDYYQEGGVIYPKLDAVEAFKRAMRTWARWIDVNMIPGKNLVFYRGYSTAHFRGGDWDSGGTCIGESEPILNSSFLDTYPPKMGIIEEAIHGIRFPVILLNVTRLTNFRKDGHPSVYRVNKAAGKKVSPRKQDCSHWCLPGVPDAWNELVYTSLILQHPLTWRRMRLEHQNISSTHCRCHGFTHSPRLMV